MVSMRSVIKKLFWVLLLFLFINDSADALVCGTDTVSYGGKNYLTVKIGTQCWFRENLNVGTMLASVTTIPTDPAPTLNSPSTVQKWCYSNSSAICTSDGGLYTWAEANALSSSCDTATCTVPVPNQGICPTGWHIPTDTEFMVLEEYLGMCSGTSTGCSGATGDRGTDQGSKLSSYTLNGNNSSGFSVLLTGLRVSTSFGSRTILSYFLSATQTGATSAWSRSFRNTYATVGRSGYVKAYGYPVRCLRTAVSPAVTTNAVTSIASGSAMGNGYVTDEGGGSNPTRYIDWGTVSGTYTNNCNAGTGGVGAYTCNITGLLPNTTYYVRARSVNSVGTSYGSEVSFTTPTNISIPIVVTQNPSNVISTFATLNGQVISSGGENSLKEIEWGVTSGVYTSSCVVGTGSEGSYSCNVTSLTPNTTYYVRAKATNSAGTGYGSEVQFITESAPVDEPNIKMRGSVKIRGGSSVGKTPL